MSAVSPESTNRDTLFIGGEFVTPLSDNVIEVICPHTGEVGGRVPEALVADVDAAVAAARQAFVDGPWSRMSQGERAAALRKFADALEARADQIANICTWQGGNLLTSHQKMNVPWGVNIVRYYADLLEKEDFLEPRQAAMYNVQIQRVPVGVVAAIVPFNVSFISALSKVAPALAAGCTVVHKPSPETPLDAYLVAEAAVEAGLPAGV